MRVIIFAIAVVSFFTLSLSLTRSQTASPASSIRDQVKQKVDEQISQIKNSSAKKAYLGSVSVKSDLTLTLINPRNLSRTITVLPDTIIKITGNKDGTIKDISLGNYVLAMGDADGNGTLTAKRLLVVGKPPPDTRRVIRGTVATFTSKSLTLKTDSGEDWTANVSSATKFTPVPAKFKDIDPGYKIIVIGTPVPGKNNTLSALLVHVASSPKP